MYTKCSASGLSLDTGLLYGVDFAFFLFLLPILLAHAVLTGQIEPFKEQGENSGKLTCMLQV